MMFFQKVSKLLLALVVLLLGVCCIYQIFGDSVFSPVDFCRNRFGAARQRIHSDFITQRRRYPKALIIGFPKCGTSALLSFLNIHPDVVSPSPEIFFFSDHYSKGLEWYRRQMPPSSPDQITVEKTAGYILKTSTLRRIYAFDPEIKLIIMLRNPVTRLLSLHAHITEKLPEPERMSFEDWLYKDHAFQQRVEYYSDYATPIEKAYNIFPKSQFLFLKEEDLEADPISVISEAQAFLGVRSVNMDDVFIFDQKKGFFCLNKTHPSLPALRNKVDHSNGCLKENKGRKHSNISDNLLRKIVKTSKPCVERLVRVTSKKFNWDYY
ncbi:sulfotransferase [Elysia marginata]|uniref:Sulfotransferase n=1 Tax=Elysia marginata TaxID=1093978 RepID=A0AAV4F1E2_9GAST|nr:sulfotransferase [Elysia marginata]